MDLTCRTLVKKVKTKTIEGILKEFDLDEACIQSASGKDAPTTEKRSRVRYLPPSPFPYTWKYVKRNMKLVS